MSEMYSVIHHHIFKFTCYKCVRGVTILMQHIINIPYNLQHLCRNMLHILLNIAIKNSLNFEVQNKLKRHIKGTCINTDQYIVCLYQQHYYLNFLSHVFFLIVRNVKRHYFQPYS